MSCVIYEWVMREILNYKCGPFDQNINILLKKSKYFVQHKHKHASVGVDVPPCTSVFPQFDKKITSLNLMMKFIDRHCQTKSKLVMHV